MKGRWSSRSGPDGVGAVGMGRREMAVGSGSSQLQRQRGQTRQSEGADGRGSRGWQLDRVVNGDCSRKRGMKSSLL